MTKRNYIDLIIDWLAGGDAPADIKGKYHPEIISKHIETIYNAIIFEDSMARIHKKQYSNLDSYTKTYYVDLELDEIRDEYYFTLPGDIIQLPDNRGIRKICLKQDQAYSFIYRSNNTVDIYSELEASMVHDRPRYYLENVKVYIDEELREEIVEEGLLAKLVVSFNEFEDTDELPVPAGKDNMIFDMIVEKLRKKPKEENYSNTTTDQV